ncbi:MAG: metallophosphoesterase [Verrucomicrobia bacterium]|nr:metallophosphoesterase [Verrucomicrobiota bacterium]
MNILFTADLHLLIGTGDQVVRRIREWIRASCPDAFVIAGDLSNASQASNVFAQLRESYPTGPIAVCLGNHDFWLNNGIRGQYQNLDSVIDDFWVSAASDHAVTILDRGNCRLEDLTLVGGYGHYDLGFAIPGLMYAGVPVTASDYLQGKPPFATQVRWRDFCLMPQGLDLLKTAAEQVSGLADRLEMAGDARVLTVLHTPPFESMLGLPSLNYPAQYAFYRAYLGNRTMGSVLERYRNKIVAIICGHTHRPFGPANVNGFIGINIGSDYGDPRAVLYCSERNQFTRLE